MLNLAVEDPDAMRAVGGRLARAIRAAGGGPPILIGLSGDLGAGKTTFVAGVLAALGHAGPVRSPTYTLIEPYRLGDRDVYHCDLYRLKDPAEVEDLGLRDLVVEGAVLLVEWPERAGDRLGQPDLSVRFAYATQGRALEIAGSSATGHAIEASLGLDAV